MGAMTFTPHARGSTLLPSKGWYYMGVYPACAGIDLINPAAVTKMFSLPRMRGDRPEATEISIYIPRFTPHARGSTPFTL